jgi:hypothetical protein
MADGEYDIFGNHVGSTKPPKLYVSGDAIEVKEGGKKYRAAKVTSFDEELGTVDISYNDGKSLSKSLLSAGISQQCDLVSGSVECGIPLGLVRKPTGAVISPSMAASNGLPPGMTAAPSATVLPEVSAASPDDRRGRREKARAIYELVKHFSEAEQDAALTMLTALDSVRASKRL